MRRNPVGYQAYLPQCESHGDGFWGNLGRLLSTTTEQAAVRLSRVLSDRRRNEISLAAENLSATPSLPDGALKPYGSKTRLYPPAAEPISAVLTDVDSPTAPISRLASRLCPPRVVEDSAPLPPPPAQEGDDPLGELFPEAVTGFFSARDSQALKNDRDLVESSRRAEEALETEHMDEIEEDPFLAHVARDLIVLERQNAMARMKMAMAGIKTRPPLHVEARELVEPPAMAFPSKTAARDAMPMSKPFREVAQRARAASQVGSGSARRREASASPVARDRDQTQLLLEHNKFLSQSIQRLAEGYFSHSETR